jgi:hypothetical protein
LVELLGHQFQREGAAGLMAGHRKNEYRAPLRRGLLFVQTTAPERISSRWQPAAIGRLFAFAIEPEI